MNTLNKNKTFKLDLEQGIFQNINTFINPQLSTLTSEDIEKMHECKALAFIYSS